MLAALLHLTDGGTRNRDLVQLAPQLTLTFTPEPLGMLFALVAGSLWPLASLYTIGYMRGAGEKNHTRFMFFYAIAIHAAMAIALSGNLLTLFVFYEVLTFSTYPLVTHKGTPEAKQARSHLSGHFGDQLGRVFAVWRYQRLDARGHARFCIRRHFGGPLDPAYVPLLLGLFAFGIGKAALMPLHRWLPAAMVAPTPVSALLHAVAVVKAGVFSMLKISIYIFGVDFLATTSASDWLVWVAAFSILAASIVALSKTNLKARLAYSTISQLGYIVLGAALASPLAASGAALHIATHATGKIRCFSAPVRFMSRITCQTFATWTGWAGACRSLSRPSRWARCRLSVCRRWPVRGRNSCDGRAMQSEIFDYYFRTGCLVALKPCLSG